MSINLSPLAGAGAQFFTDDGVPLSGGLLYSYQAGTTTPVVTYTTVTGNVNHSNPIVLDSAGRVPGGEIWLSSAYKYKFVLKDSNGVLIATWDNLSGMSGVGQQGTATATQGQTVFTIGFPYVVGGNSLQIFVNGSKQISGLNYNETNTTTITFVDGLNAGDVLQYQQ